MLSPEGKDLVGGEKKQLVSRRTGSGSSTISLKVTECEDADGYDKTTMNIRKSGLLS